MKEILISKISLLRGELAFEIAGSADREECVRADVFAAEAGRRAGFAACSRAGFGLSCSRERAGKRRRHLAAVL